MKTIAQIAKMYKKTPETIWNWVKAGLKVEHVDKDTLGRKGKFIRINPKDVDEFLIKKGRGEIRITK